MNAQLETAPSAAAAQAQIADEFAFFGDWTERYQYLIDLGRKLPPFPDELKTEANKVQGCQSQVWLVAEARFASEGWLAAEGWLTAERWLVAKPGFAAGTLVVLPRCRRRAFVSFGSV